MLGALAARLQRPVELCLRGARLCSSGVGYPAEASSSVESMMRSIENGVAPATGRKYSQIGASVFGHMAPLEAGEQHQRRSGRELLKRKLKGDLVVGWYLPTAEQDPANPLKLTAKQERWRAKLSVMRMQGRGPPKKGAGKRSK